MFFRSARLVWKQEELSLKPLGACDEVAKCSVNACGNDEVQEWQLVQKFFEKLRDGHEGLHGHSVLMVCRRIEHDLLRRSCFCSRILGSGARVDV